jgi:hypothetical protein
MDGVWIECETLGAADALWAALDAIDGVEVTRPLLKAGPVDSRLVVEVIAVTVLGARLLAPTIIEALKGYAHIKINGKVTVLDVVSVEGSIEASRHDHGNRED